MEIPEWIRELRPHAIWDIIRETITMMLPFLAGLGIKSWVHDYATPLMWTGAFVASALIAFSDRLLHRGSNTGMSHNRSLVHNGQLLIHSANWAPKGATFDVTATVRRLISNDRLDIPVDVKVLGDKHHGDGKFLTVSYSIGKLTAKPEWPKPSRLVLPERPHISVVKVYTDNDPTAKGYPLKIRYELKNGSDICLDVKLHAYGLNNTFVLKQVVNEVLQVKFYPAGWFPIDDGGTNVAVLPDQEFRGWIAVNDSRFSKAQIDVLIGNLGKVILYVNGDLIEISI
jgi:hypothetical protein